MRKISRRCCLVLFIGALLSHCCAGEDAKAPADEPQAVTEQVRELDVQIAEIGKQEQAQQAEIREFRKQTSEIQLHLQNLLKQIEAIQTEQKTLKKTHEEQVKAAQEADVKRKEAEVAAEKARQLAEQAKLAAEEAAKLPLKTIEQVTALAMKLEPLQTASMGVAEQNQRMLRQLNQLDQRVAELRKQRDLHRGQIESLLRDAGEWVSFTDQIAPIFHQRCVVCHNSRNARGQYLMTSYFAIMTTGESDGAVAAGNSDDSLLCMLIEDGSMPKDADPLEAQQIQLIRRWVDQGARLDLGAAPEEPLIRIMPRSPQPLPPEIYHAPVPITALAVAPDGKLLASSGYHEVLLWSFPESQLVSRLSNVAERVYGLDFHPDGRRLAVASGTPGRLGDVKLFDIQTGELLSDLFVSEDAMFAVAFSPDGQQLAASGAEGLIAIVDLEHADTSKPLLINSHSDWVNDIAWSADGKHLVSASRDKTAKVFLAATGELQLTFNGHGANVTSARFVEGGKQVASVGHDRQIRIWNVADAKETLKIGGFSSPLNSLQVLNESSLATSGAMPGVFIRRANDAKHRQDIKVGTDWISSLTVSADGSQLLTGDQTGLITVIQLESGAIERSWAGMPPIKGPQSDVPDEETKTESE